MGPGTGRQGLSFASDHAANQKPEVAKMQIAHTRGPCQPKAVWAYM